MKTKNMPVHRKFRKILSLSVLSLAASLAALPSLHATLTPTKLPLPDFMTPAQLTKWKADLAAKVAAADKVQTSDSTSQGLNSGVPTPLAPQKLGAALQSNQLPPVAGFYTGKPYIAETGGYAFKYREYNPEMNRWTTVDPSGFPDGANNRVYVKNPINHFDSNGLDDSILSVVYTFDESANFLDITQGATIATGALGAYFGARGGALGAAVGAAGGIVAGYLISGDWQTSPWVPVGDDEPQVSSAWDLIDVSDPYNVIPLGTTVQVNAIIAVYQTQYQQVTETFTYIE